MNPGRGPTPNPARELALDPAHARKLIHRDLKPDNLFLCQTREGDIVKILDFGSVKDKTEGAKKLTVLGTTIGSPFYMAPEQFQQEFGPLGPWTDVWALGIILYELLTGGVPYQSSNAWSLANEVVNQPPPPPSLPRRPRLPGRSSRPCRCGPRP